uniref:Usher syndrome type-1G protein homolog n=1 Tax=Ciona intestinalis TaxID=7719 RepID=UPI0000521D69|nr:Usher syndrome type-1G protein homolog [Ciona intestinalis]|eukprot:XP_002127434.3 Usher syndrome type-1G protein homolog [Ciona intestinalis]
MSTRYHRAACDNRLDVLKEATKKDLNQQDDGGMTPTLWAAYYGFLPALRVCCSRGGQVDKCDYLGNTALHLAAQNGHLDSVSFLVNFGANVWKVDNSYNSAQDLAGIRNQTKCVKYLDQQVAKMTVENGKQAKKMKEQAKKEAEKRIVKFEKMQNKMKQKIEKDSSAGRKLSTTNSVEEKSNGRKYSSSTMNNPRKISSSNKPDKNLRDNPQTISGIPSQRLPNVTYMPTERFGASLSTQTKRPPVNEIFPESMHDEGYPKFNTALKWNTKSSANAMTSLHNQVMQDYDDGGELNEDGTPSYVKPVFAKYESKQTDDDNFSLGESDSAEELTELEFFLNSIKLEDYIPLFQDEKMDMEALALCTSDDLIQMGLPLGPRKKILQGLSEREKPDSGNELTLL